MRLTYAEMCIRISEALLAVSRGLIRASAWMGGRAGKWTARAREIVEQYKGESGRTENG